MALKVLIRKIWVAHRHAERKPPRGPPEGPAEDKGTCPNTDHHSSSSELNHTCPTAGQLFSLLPSVKPEHCGSAGRDRRGPQAGEEATPLLGEKDALKEVDKPAVGTFSTLIQLMATDASLLFVAFCAGV